MEPMDRRLLLAGLGLAGSSLIARMVQAGEFEPPTGQSVSDPLADVDQDGDVDQVNLAQLQRCMGRAHIGIAEGCECYNRPEPPALARGDADVDLADLDAFLVCAGGPAVPAMIDCDD